ncbi:MAG: MMPL family transporter [Desulfobulbaceae bacterium]|nr:MMPL family transporter [Desulfobulbaceae bacterium]
MHITEKLTRFAIESPEVVKKIFIILTAILGVFCFRLHIDTDPEHMLSEGEFARSFHAATKLEFNLNEVIVLGIVNEEDPDGVFNPDTLKKIQHLGRFGAQLIDEHDPRRYVVKADVISPDNVEVITRTKSGKIAFSHLMETVPLTREEARKVKTKALANPFLNGTMVSEDGRAIALYFPITQKDFAPEIIRQLQKQIAPLHGGNDQFYITGHPVNENIFGNKMLIQAAIYTPLVILTMFLLVLVLFRNPALSATPLIISLVTVTCTMGLLIGTGTPLNLITALIPIILIPISVAGAVHILSEFYDDYQKMLDRRRTILHVMDKVSVPMFQTTLITATAFGSLVLAPLPPLKIFGIFTAIGTILAWLLTALFIPAQIITIREENFIHFGNKELISSKSYKSFLHRHLRWIGRTSLSAPGLLLALGLIFITIGIIGTKRNTLTDNPGKWFQTLHEISPADEILNKHFGGINDAYLILNRDESGAGLAKAEAWLSFNLGKKLKDNEKVRLIAFSQLAEAMAVSEDENAMYQELLHLWQAEYERATDEDEKNNWAKALDSLDGLSHREQFFRRPDILNYIANLQNYLTEMDYVKKSSSIADLIRTIHYETVGEEQGNLITPKSWAEIDAALQAFQQSSKQKDLWHLVTPDFKKTAIRLQLKGGENSPIEKIMADVNKFMEKNPPAERIEINWAGLSYVNDIQNDKVASGMLESALICSAALYIMLTLFFRSLLWGLLSIIPFGFAIIFSYGLMGLIDATCNVPVAIVAALSLGLAVDCGVHLLERARFIMGRNSNWPLTVSEIFEEPARAIFRNSLIIGLGFTPLLLAPLTVYQSLGFLLIAILLFSGIATIWFLPALLTLIQNAAFHK